MSQLKFRSKNHSLLEVYIDCWRCEFNPWVRKIPWRRKWQPTLVSLPGKSHRQRSLVGYIPWGGKSPTIIQIVCFMLRYLFNLLCSSSSSHHLNNTYPVKSSMVIKGTEEEKASAWQQSIPSTSMEVWVLCILWPFQGSWSILTNQNCKTFIQMKVNLISGHESYISKPWNLSKYLPWE